MCHGDGIAWGGGSFCSRALIARNCAVSRGRRGGMTLRDMGDLVCEDAGYLRLVRGSVERAPMQPDRPAGQRERIDLPVVDHRERIGIRGPGATFTRRAATPRT